MSDLESVLLKVQELAKAQKWQEIIDADDEVRSAVLNATQSVSAGSSSAIEAQIRHMLTLYELAIEHLKSEQGSSAKQLHSMQRGLKAAKSYLNFSK